MSAPQAERGELVVQIDFDWTLSDTTASSNDLWKLMAERGGRTVEQAQADGEGFHPDPVLGGYDFNAHVDAYGLDRDEMWEELDHLVRAGDYLYDDSVAFMHGLRDEGFDPSILSFGEDRFQRAKIVPVLGRLSGPRAGSVLGEPIANLPVDVVFRKKGPYLAETYPGRRGVLVDDKPDQNLPEGFTEVHLDRGLYLPNGPEEKLGGFVVANLHQALEVIRAL